ncbi:hypothetical protein AB0436_22990 [Streptomyces sp. NPDC051322]|uniref:hypothetical protein n=1 Tax=Streptomyces sp. NPDC051322 TaxID=3154645 RepID=UPI00344DDD20
MTDRDARLREELAALGRRLGASTGSDLVADGESMAERVLAQIIAESVPAGLAPPLPGVPETEAPGRFTRARTWAGRRWRAVLAALCGLLAALILSPPVRGAVADWFGPGGVPVRYAPAALAPTGQSVDPGRPADLALVIAAGSGRSETLTAEDADFIRLFGLLNPQSTDTEPAPEDRAPQVRASVVWGLSGVGGWPQTDRAPGGDIAIEREDQVMVADDSTVWVRSDPAVGTQDDDLRWHRVPADVLGLLAKHRLLGPPTAETSGEASRAGWWWASAALAVGAVAGYGWAVLRRRRDPGPPEPHQQLIDLDA